jgi:hypothetical protein
MRRKLAPEREILKAVVALADDGFCLRQSLFRTFAGSASAICEEASRGRYDRACFSSAAGLMGASISRSPARAGNPYGKKMIEIR